MADAPPPDAAGFALASAAAQGLPLPEAYLPGVTANIEVAFRLSRLFLDFGLPDDAEPSPVFDPAEGGR
jgi:hypothetical protein